MAAAVKTLSVTEQIQQLNEARKIVLENASYYDRIVKGILPIIGPSSPVELRRWGAEFLAESLSTPVLNSRDKENLTVAILDTLRLLLESKGEDPLVLKASIIAAASAYPIAMRWIIHNSYHKESWDAMTAIKSRILRIWDGASTPVKVCCVKFAQRVVLAQTASNGMEYKMNGLDVSLAMVPPNHPLLDHRLLEAEAAGLLDRMLAVLQDNSSDALLVDATLNCLSILIRSRPSTSNRIMNTVLGFNPLKLANSPMTPKTKVLIKSMEKTTRMLLIHLVKRDPTNALAPRINQHIDRLMRSRAEIFDDSNRKRAYAPPPANEYDNAKRQKVNGEQPQTAPAKPWTPGPQSLAAVFSLTNIMGLQGFDATQVPAALTAKINTKCLASMNPQVFDQAVNTIRTRLATLYALAPPVQPPPVLNPETSPLGVDEDDDDYEPDFYAAEDNEQILNKLDSAPADKALARGPDPAALAPLGPFKLPAPPLVDSQVAIKVGQATSSRVFAPLPSLEEGALRKPKAGINRLAASTYDRDSWLTLITRLATRSAIEDGTSGGGIKAEDGGGAVASGRSPHLSNMIRELLYNYVLEDWRRRIEVAVAWLCEEWYNDQLTKRAGTGAPLHYERWALRLVDGFLSYITAQDKVLTRFLAEIPELSRPLLGRLKALCGDPTKVQLALTSLLYLVMMRPPVREVALDTVAGIWMEYEDARPLASKYLVKWRPGFIESQQQIKAQ
ncbi:mRNA cleavage and polyadenylation specificity factor complex subunit pta1 [Podospora conica]|nr:mRNA cleavage and polyadenylation specificity factor complex subunit pta1 [Schizothecium conicum]